MDKRKGSTHARSRGRVKGQSGHPGSSRRKGRPMTTGRGRNGRSGTRHAKKVNRARKRRNKFFHNDHHIIDHDFGSRRSFL